MGFFFSPLLSSPPIPPPVFLIVSSFYLLLCDAHVLTEAELSSVSSVQLASYFHQLIYWLVRTTIFFFNSPLLAFPPFLGGAGQAF